MARANFTWTVTTNRGYSRSHKSQRAAEYELAYLLSRGYGDSYVYRWYHDAPHDRGDRIFKPSPKKL